MCACLGGQKWFGLLFPLNQSQEVKAWLETFRKQLLITQVVCLNQTRISHFSDKQRFRGQIMPYRTKQENDDSAINVQMAENVSLHQILLLLVCTFVIKKLIQSTILFFFYLSNTGALACYTAYALWTIVTLWWFTQLLKFQWIFKQRKQLFTVKGCISAQSCFSKL